MTAPPFQAPTPDPGMIGGRPSVPVPLPSNVPSYRTPSLYEENGYVDSPVGAYAPVLRVSAMDATPDSRRIGREAIHEYRPDPSRPPEEFWTGQGGPGRDIMVRHMSAETIDSNPDVAFRGTNYDTAKRAAPDPRRTPAPENRWTQKLSPSSHEFERPFAQHIPHRFTGQRFSMADHRRRYEDMQGMQPQMTRRNTYRQDPGPWDQYLTDYPVNTPVDWGGYRTAAIPMNGNRSGRLDSY